MRKLLIASLALVLGPAYGQQRFTDWETAATEYGAIAATQNESNATFGKICYSETQNCLWALLDATTCNDGESTPALVTSAAGAAHVTLLCSISEEGKVYLIHPYDDVQKSIAVSGRIGFAFPLADGQFRVVRFSLSGSSVASASAEAIVTKQTRNSTKDMSL